MEVGQHLSFSKNVTGLFAYRLNIVVWLVQWPRLNLGFHSMAGLVQATGQAKTGVQGETVEISNIRQTRKFHGNE
jgi:hypothetical protein